jgi:hypothetical protein
MEVEKKTNRGITREQMKVEEETDEVRERDR